MIETIKKAIHNKIELILTTKNGLGDKTVEVIFQPYIYGCDKMQNEFIWGFLPYSMSFYKFDISNIDSLELTGDSYTVLSAAYYRCAAREKHYAVIQGFNKIFAR